MKMLFNAASTVAILCHIFAVASSADEIPLGVVAPLTGIRADAGEYIKNAVQLAVEEINTEGEADFTLQPYFEDSKYSAKEAVSGLRKLISKNDTRYILGPYSSSSVLAVASITEKAGILLIVPGAQSDDISDAGSSIFRVIHNAAQEAPFFAKRVSDRMSSETLHFLVMQTSFTYSYLKHFRPALTSEGKNVGLIEEYSPETTDFRAYLLKIKSQKPTDVFLFATPSLAGHILKQSEEIGLKAQFYNIGVEGPEMLQIAGPLAEGLIYPYSYDSGSSDPNIKEFISRYISRFKSEPDTVAANSYDGVKLLGHCLRKVGDKPKKVKECFYQTREYRGASGLFSIDSHGDAIKQLIVKTVRDGKFVKLEDENK